MKPALNRDSRPERIPDAHQYIDQLKAERRRLICAFAINAFV